MLLDPLRLDIALSSQEHSVLELLLKLDDELSSYGEYNSVRLEVDEH
jgi:hypothetical protein